MYMRICLFKTQHKQKPHYLIVTPCLTAIALPVLWLPESQQCWHKQLRESEESIIKWRDNCFFHWVLECSVLLCPWLIVPWNKIQHVLILRGVFFLKGLWCYHQGPKENNTLLLGRVWSSESGLQAIMDACLHCLVTRSWSDSAEGPQYACYLGGLHR